MNVWYDTSKKGLIAAVSAAALTVALPAHAEEPANVHPTGQTSPIATFQSVASFHDEALRTAGLWAQLPEVEDKITVYVSLAKDPVATPEQIASGLTQDFRSQGYGPVHFFFEQSDKPATMFDFFNRTDADGFHHVNHVRD